MISLATVFAGLFALNLVQARLFFDTKSTKAGTFLAYPKPKNGLEMLGEDSFGTSPVGLVVCDGVGSGFVSSKYISEQVTLGWANFVNEYFIKGNGAMPEPDTFFTEAKKLLEAKRGEYKTRMEAHKADFVQKTGQGECLKSFTTDSSTTFISATLAEVKGVQRMYVVQKGDSLLTVYRKTASGANFVYLPFYMTNEQQHFFNCPFQINSEAASQDTEIYTYNLEVKPLDMAVIGSDGVFDNMGVGLMAMIINDMIAFPTKTREAAINKFIAFCRVYHWITWFKQFFLYKFFTPPDGVKTHKTFDRAAKLKEVGSLENQRPNFPAELDKFFAATLAPYTLPEKEIAAWKRYFLCPVLDMVSFPEKFDESDKLIEECTKKTIMESLAGTPDQFAAYAKADNNVFRSDVLAKVTYFLSHIKSDYTNTFTIRGWYERVVYPDRGAGKEDDITIVASVLQDQTADGPAITQMKELLTSHKEQNTEEDSTWSSKFTIDVPMVFGNLCKGSGQNQGNAQNQGQQSGRKSVSYQGNKDEEGTGQEKQTPQTTTEQKKDTPVNQGITQSTPNKSTVEGQAKKLPTINSKSSGGISKGTPQQMVSSSQSGIKKTQLVDRSMV